MERGLGVNGIGSIGRVVSASMQKKLTCGEVSLRVMANAFAFAGS